MPSQAKTAPRIAASTPTGFSARAVGSLGWAPISKFVRHHREGVASVLIYVALAAIFWGYLYGTASPTHKEPPR